jgi:hypothetical protein
MGFAPHLAKRFDVIHGLSPGEAVYRGMMVFYGLIFPAYIWLCAIPTRDGHAGITDRQGRRKAVIWVGAIILALPAYWLGFLAREPHWLAVGLGVVLLARLVLPRSHAATQGDGITDTSAARS